MGFDQTRQGHKLSILLSGAATTRHPCPEALVQSLTNFSKMAPTVVEVAVVSEPAQDREDW